jgi:hypothetical protein
MAKLNSQNMKKCLFCKEKSLFGLTQGVKTKIFFPIFLLLSLSVCSIRKYCLYSTLKWPSLKAKIRKNEDIKVW